MSNLYKEREQGQAAEQILSNPIWTVAWDAYRLRILELIESAGSDDVGQVMHLKRMLAATTGAKGHMERIMKEGAVAAKMIELQEHKPEDALARIRRIAG